MEALARKYDPTKRFYSQIILVDQRSQKMLFNYFKYCRNYLN